MVQKNVRGKEMAVQAFIKRGTRSNATARRLIASTTVAPHVLAETVSVTKRNDEIISVKAGYTVNVAGMIVEKGEQYHLVASEKFATRYYCVRYNRLAKQWECSASDKRVAATYIHTVKSFIVARLAAGNEAA